MGGYRYVDQQLILDPGDEAALMAMLRQSMGARDFGELKNFANLITEPITTIANYEEWAAQLFVPKQINPGDDWKLPLEEYNLTAFFSSPEGRIRRSRVGLIWTRPDFSTIRSGFEIFWDDLQNATWNIVGNKVMRTGQELARKRDQLALGVLLGAANSVNHVINTTGGVLTRTGVDAIFKGAASIGFPIQKVVANWATLQDMRSAQFFTWDNSKFPIAPYPASYGEAAANTGYIGNYSGAQWLGTIGLSSGTIAGQFANPQTFPITAGASVVFYVGAAPTLGFQVRRGAPRQMSDVDIDNMINRYMWDETLFYYVANPFAVWCQVITP